MSQCVDVWIYVGVYRIAIIFWCICLWEIMKYIASLKELFSKLLPLFESLERNCKFWFTCSEWHDALICIDIVIIQTRAHMWQNEINYFPIAHTHTSLLTLCVLAKSIIAWCHWVPIALILHVFVLSIYLDTASQLYSLSLTLIKLGIKIHSIIHVCDVLRSALRYNWCDDIIHTIYAPRYHNV